MSLYKRLHDAQAAPEQPVDRRGSSSAELHERLHGLLIEELGPDLIGKVQTEEEMRRKVADRLGALLLRERAPLSASDRAQLVQDISDDILGYGPIDKFLKDDDVDDILVNGPRSVFVERKGVLEKTGATFSEASHLRRIIDKIVSEVGRRIDEATPMCDARLPDGSRVNAVIHPLAVGGPYLTIRKFHKERLKVDDLIKLDTLTPDAARFLQACIVGRLNVIVAGGSGCGKTTMLNVLSGFIPADERIITVEDAKELQLHQDHVLALESRPPNVDGVGEVSIRDLVKNTLRMRPDRIIVGECRGGEALDMLQAMNTGHDGSVTTVHANSPRDTLSRIETLVLMAGFDLPVRAIREQMASALDLVVQMARLRDGSRRITALTELQGMEGDTISLQDIFAFDYGAGMTDKGRLAGKLVPTGVRPKFTQKLVDQGIRLPPELFQAREGQKVLTSGHDEEPQPQSTKVGGGRRPSLAEQDRADSAAARASAPPAPAASPASAPAAVARDERANGAGIDREVLTLLTEILKMVSDGFSTLEVADKLEVSPTTVKAHLDQLYQKLGVAQP